MRQTVGERGASAALPRTRGAQIALTAFVLTALAATRLTAQLAVDQTEVFMTPGSGPSVASINVLNDGDQTVDATVYLNDWDRDTTGENRFVAPGTLPSSCGAHLRAFPLSLRLPPHARQTVRVALTGADSIKAACWSVVFIETAPAPPRASGPQVSYVIRTGVKIYVLPTGLTKEGEVVDMQFHKAATPKDTSRVEVLFHSTGGLPVGVRGTVEFRRLDNSVAATDTIEDFPVLPGAERRARVVLPRLAAGHYIALALLDYGGAELAAGQVTVDVP